MPRSDRNGALLGLVGIAGHVLGVVFLADVPGAYRPAGIDAWLAGSLAHRADTAASAAAFVVGLVALAGWAWSIGRWAARPLGRAGAGAMAVGALLNAAQHINLFAILRTLPVGLPSLMASRQPITTPLGNPQIWEVTSLGAVMGIWVLLSLVGLVVGTFYFMAVAQASLSEKISWTETLANWPTASLKVLLLALLWFGLLVAISLPASCLITLVALTGLGGGMLPFLIFGGIALWLFFPLVFSPHGIFANQRTMWGSVSDSVRLARMTLPTTGLLLIIILVISEGTDMLWNIPEDASWLTLLALIGHAFITTGLLAASFVYYRDATRWAQRLIQQTKLSSIT